MPSTFQSLNETSGGGVPQFAQTQPVVGGGAGEALVTAAGVGANLFSQLAGAKLARESKEADTANTTALGGLQQGLLNIRQAGATDSSIDVTRQSRLLLTQFNNDHPELRMEASKAYKAETGNTPSGLDEQEEAELKLRNEAIATGFGKHGASDEYNQEQFELYQNLKRQDKVLSSKIQEMSFQVQEKAVHKSALKDTVLSSFQELSATYSRKTQSSMTELVTQWESGSVQTEEAVLEIRQARNAINREIATLGEFSTDPSVRAYVQPMLDSLALAEDIVNGKIEQEAVDAVINTNKSRAKAVFMSDPNTVNLVVASEAFNHTTGVQSKISKSVMSFLVEGLDENGMLPTKPKPVNPLGMDKDEQDGIKAVVSNMAGDEKAGSEVANMMAGLAEHLGRNGMDYDPEDKKFAIDVLNTEGAMKLLSPEQKGAVMVALDMYVVDTVDVAAKKYITEHPQVSVGAPFPRVLGGGGPELKEFTDVADIKIVDGRIYWTAKRAFAGNPSVQGQIRTANKNIEESITPAVNVYANGLGIPFKESVGIFIPEQAEEGEEGDNTPAKKTEEVEVDTTSPKAFLSSTMPTITEVVSGTGIFPEVAAAQAALESGWGKEVKGGNYYGIKGEGQTVTTHEVIDGKRVKLEDEFKEFGGFTDSVVGYRDFLTTNPRYAEAIKAETPEEQAKALQEAGYATDPEYADKLISIMKRIKGGK